MSLTVSAIKTERKENEFDLYETIIEAVKNSKMSLKNGDVLVISSKFISNSQGRIIEINNVHPSVEGNSLSKKYQIDSKISEVILRESEKIFGGISGFVITSSDNILAPNAGIDKSNAKKGKVILYPYDPYNIAEQLRRKIFLKNLIHVGIIIVDSRLMPSRIGTTGVAIACAGFEPILDLRSKKDLHGNPLKVTFQSVVDNFASIGNHEMGEGSESKPLAIIRNSDVILTDRKINPDEISISHEQCVFIRGMKNSE